MRPPFKLITLGSLSQWQTADWHIVLLPKGIKILTSSGRERSWNVFWLFLKLQFMFERKYRIMVRRDLPELEFQYFHLLTGTIGLIILSSLLLSFVKWNNERVFFFLTR
jgi:hypothetical protein